MKNLVYAVTLGIVVLFSNSACKQPSEAKVDPVSPAIAGTWQLLSGTLIEDADTTITDYTKGISMLKIINDTHFAFVNHDLKHGKDSTASFSAGGGRYSLYGDTYTEYLTYCSAREWEGNEFKFTIEIRNDSLIQKGVEKIENIGVDRMNIEVYRRVE
jgi:hypothetical protein